MTSRQNQVTLGWVEYRNRGVVEPGWYVQYILDRKVQRVRLEIDRGADAFGAVDAAASLLGCSSDQLEVKGPVWPDPLYRRASSDETLEYAPDVSGEPIARRRRWRRIDH